MDKNVHPLAAFLVIVIAAATIATWFWARGEAREYGGPAGLMLDPDGHLYIQVRNQLLEHDADGDFVGRHDLSQLGVDFFLGGADFFSNGDILLRRGPDTRSFSDTVRAYQRKTNTASLVPDAPDTGLFRCNLDAKECRVFGAKPIDFKSAFSVYIDRETDDVYIADSSRHLVRKYTSAGVEAFAPASGFKFPNQLMLRGRDLLVADTNHHRIRAIRMVSDGFGSTLFNSDVVPQLATSNGQEWPSHFVRVGDEWWVNNMKSGMNYGGIYVFDNDWRFQRMIELPGDADPISMIAFGDEVLISDWYGDRVHRVSPDGRVLGDFASTGVTELLAEFDARRGVFMLYAWVAVGLGLVFVAILVIKGTDWAGKDKPPDREHPTAAPGEPILLEPDSENVKKLRSNMRLLRLLIMPIAIGFPILALLVADNPMAINLVIAGVGFFAFFALVDWATRGNLGTSILIDRDTITLRNDRGHQVRSSLSNVFFTDTVVLADDLAVFLGQGQTPIYERELVIRELEQRLPPSQRISAWAMQKKLLAIRHPYAMMIIAAVIMSAVIAAAVHFGG